MDVFLTTLVKRPYVFLFLAGFLFLAIRHIGLAKALIWLTVGYAIAFVSEYSSIHNGFPYGEYHYIYENLQGELLLAGVPVWDSMSYSFMTYASFAAAKYALPAAKTWKLWITASALTTLLDIITDPVAKLGKDWFLGEIYYYANDGWYFNVPFSNFAGWLLVAAAIIGANLLIFKILDHAHYRKCPQTSQSCKSVCWLHLLFYSSICLFSTAIAFMIGSYLLAFVNLTITTLITLGIIVFRKRSLRS